MNTSLEQALHALADLGGGSLPWLALTLGAFAAGTALQRRLRSSPWANPVLIATAIVVVVLGAGSVPYERYWQGAQFINFLLGPAVVALAVPLRRHWAAVRAGLTPMAGALLAGHAAGALVTVGIMQAWHAPASLVASIAPKSVTAPVAMRLAESLGGVPALTAVLVIGTGIVGATIATAVLNLCRVRDPAARGFAIGVASHGIGTARAFQESQLTGTFAAIGMVTSTVVVSLLLPPLLRGW